MTRIQLETQVLNETQRDVLTELVENFRDNTNEIEVDTIIDLLDPLSDSQLAALQTFAKEKSEECTVLLNNLDTQRTLVEKRKAWYDEVANG